MAKSIRALILFTSLALVAEARKHHLEIRGDDRKGGTDS